MFFVWRGPTSADDSDRILIAFSPDDENETGSNWTDGNESVFIVRMGFVEDLKVVATGAKELGRFSERDKAGTCFGFGSLNAPILPKTPLKAVAPKACRFVRREWRGRQPSVHPATRPLNRPQNNRDWVA